ncbi:MAG TPA: hypothetical protein DDW52_17505 [Planctomycetaceae bacterium]|nr:hypothetical protein [Planctomycetaceae bacterium]
MGKLVLAVAFDFMSIGLHSTLFASPSGRVPAWVSALVGGAIPPRKPLVGAQHGRLPFQTVLGCIGNGLPRLANNWEGLLAAAPP